MPERLPLRKFHRRSLVLFPSPPSFFPALSLALVFARAPLSERLEQASIFLVSARTHSISRYIHIQTLCVHKRKVLRFLQHGTYHVVVRGGSHFCQSPKGGGSGVFSLKRKGGPTLFWEKNTKIPQPSPPQEKRTFPNQRTLKILLCLWFVTNMALQRENFDRLDLLSYCRLVAS